jgi:hypothetical protein
LVDDLVGPLSADPVFFSQRGPCSSHGSNFTAPLSSSRPKGLQTHNERADQYRLRGSRYTAESHMAEVERNWFRRVLAAELIDSFGLTLRATTASWCLSKALTGRPTSRVSGHVVRRAAVPRQWVMDPVGELTCAPPQVILRCSTRPNVPAV